LLPSSFSAQHLALALMRSNEEDGKLPARPPRVDDAAATPLFVEAANNKRRMQRRFRRGAAVDVWVNTGGKNAVLCQNIPAELCWGDMPKQNMVLAKRTGKLKRQLTGRGKGKVESLTFHKYDLSQKDNPGSKIGAVTLYHILPADEWQPLEKLINPAAAAAAAGGKGGGSGSGMQVVDLSVIEQLGMLWKRPKRERSSSPPTGSASGRGSRNKKKRRSALAAGMIATGLIAAVLSFHGVLSGGSEDSAAAPISTPASFECPVDTYWQAAPHGTNSCRQCTQCESQGAWTIASCTETADAQCIGWKTAPEWNQPAEEERDDEDDDETAGVSSTAHWHLPEDFVSWSDGNQLYAFGGVSSSLAADSSTSDVCLGAASGFDANYNAGESVGEPQLLTNELWVLRLPPESSPATGDGTAGGTSSGTASRAATEGPAADNAGRWELIGGGPSRAVDQHQFSGNVWQSTSWSGSITTEDAAPWPRARSGAAVWNPRAGLGLLPQCSNPDDPFCAQNCCNYMSSCAQLECHECLSAGGSLSGVDGEKCYQCWNQAVDEFEGEVGTMSYCMPQCNKCYESHTTEQQQGQGRAKMSSVVPVNAVSRVDRRSRTNGLIFSGLFSRPCLSSQESWFDSPSQQAPADIFLLPNDLWSFNGLTWVLLGGSETWVHQRDWMELRDTMDAGYTSSSKEDDGDREEGEKWPLGRWGSQTWMLGDTLYLYSGQTIFASINGSSLGNLDRSVHPDTRLRKEQKQQHARRFLLTDLWALKQQPQTAGKWEFEMKCKCTQDYNDHCSWGQPRAAETNPGPRTGAAVWTSSNGTTAFMFGGLGFQMTATRYWAVLASRRWWVVDSYRPEPLLELSLNKHAHNAKNVRQNQQTIDLWEQRDRGSWVGQQDWAEYSQLCDLWTVSAKADTEFRMLGACQGGRAPMLRIERPDLSEPTGYIDADLDAAYPEALQTGYRSTTWTDDVGDLWLFGGAERHIGGLGSGGLYVAPPNVSLSCSSALWRYEIAVGSWSEIGHERSHQSEPPLPPPSRAEAATATTDDEAGVQQQQVATTWPAALCGATAWRPGGETGRPALAVLGGWTQGPALAVATDEASAEAEPAAERSSQGDSSREGAYEFFWLQRGQGAGDNGGGTEAPGGEGKADSGVARSL
jgi:hypothetical protein